MGFLSRFEGKMEDTFEGAVDKIVDAPISPVQIAKKAEKQMRREKMVGAGKQYAPTLYTVLVNPDDDDRLFGYYPTLAGETETYLAAKAADEGLVMDGQPLVRFVVDDDLKRGKFDVIAEAVAAPIVKQLRAEEMERYGISQPASYDRSDYDYAAGAPRGGYASSRQGRGGFGYDDYDNGSGYDAGGAAYDSYGTGRNADYDDGYGQAAAPAKKEPLPYVPEDEIDYSIDYGEYTFDSAEFEDYRDETPRGSHRAAGAVAGVAAGAAMGAAAGAAAMEAPHTAVFAGGAGQAHPAVRGARTEAQLVDVTNHRTYDLAAMRLLIGRESGNDIVVPDINASRTHAEIRLEHGSIWVINDLGSTNGTFVDGRRVGTHELRDGERITIGTTNYVFELV